MGAIPEPPAGDQARAGGDAAGPGRHEGPVRARRGARAGSTGAAAIDRATHGRPAARRDTRRRSAVRRDTRRPAAHWGDTRRRAVAAGCAGDLAGGTSRSRNGTRQLAARLGRGGAPGTVSGGPCRGGGGAPFGSASPGCPGDEVNPSAVPRAGAADATSQHRPSAPLLRRYAAVGYETLVVGAIVLVAGFLTAARPSATAGTPPLSIPGPAARSLSAALVFALVGLYCVISWTGGRRTLPMKTWRLSLVRADGTPLGGRTAVVRYLAAWIGPLAALVGYAMLRSRAPGAYALWLVALNFVWALVDPERRFLHDRLAGTTIVVDPPR